jgi:hypothetical protein
MDTEYDSDEHKYFRSQHEQLVQDLLYSKIHKLLYCEKCEKLRLCSGPFLPTFFGFTCSTILVKNFLNNTSAGLVI